MHWIGTGLSTGSGLGLMCDGAETTLWGRTEAKAEAKLAALGLTGRARPMAFAPDTLAAEVVAGDVVVSMLPAGEHPPLVALALAQGAHFACSSYLSPEIAGYADEARARGSVVLTEIGLDPGIDHLLAHELVRRATAATGDRPATVHFTSYCGCNPAVPNDFRYRFAWRRGACSPRCSPRRG